MTAQDKELFSQLYDRNYKRLLYAAIRIAHNPFTAEELTNEAFTILLTHFDRVRQHPNLPGWLHTVLTNLALDEYKRQSRYVQVPLDSVQNLAANRRPFLCSTCCRMNYPTRIKRFYICGIS
ncbi:MAG: RNA polymerase sigma factor [Butyricicoccus sp.]